MYVIEFYIYIFCIAISNKGTKYVRNINIISPIKNSFLLFFGFLYDSSSTSKGKECFSIKGSSGTLQMIKSVNDGDIIWGAKKYRTGPKISDRRSWPSTYSEYK
ncbi:hypothetical protein NLC29_00070 [Candidatus Aminicenantes bacterium AH-873-B07]|nr:hypothetical protein [Candidatus Aminicenantes bacterium AH-873-B07]